MIRHLCAQIVIPRDTNLPEDSAVNSWSFVWDDTVFPSITPTLVGIKIKQRLGLFYQAIDEDLSSKNNNPVVIKVYDRADAIPRVPLFNDFLEPLVFGPNGLPSEAAVVLSFSAAVAAGENRANRRGRLYMGPMSAQTMETGLGDIYVFSDVRQRLVNAALALRNASDDSLKWEVWSPTLQQGFEVIRGYVDNAFDTIRSRGPKATGRNLWGTP